MDMHAISGLLVLFLNDFVFALARQASQIVQAVRIAGSHPADPGSSPGAGMHAFSGLLVYFLNDFVFALVSTSFPHSLGG